MNVTNENCLSFDDLKGEAHVCSVYKYPIEQTLTTIAFFTPALSTGSKCVYVSSQMDKNRLIEEFGKKWPEAKKHIESGQLLLLDHEVYLTGNDINTENMLESIRNIEKQAAKEGYKNVRFSGEIPFVSGGVIDEKNIVNYELAEDKYLRSSGSSAICHYNETKYDPEMLIKIIVNYPYIMIYGSLYKNNCFQNYSGNNYEELLETIITGQAP
jgi:hypothetical protein